MIRDGRAAAAAEEEGDAAAVEYRVEVAAADAAFRAAGVAAEVGKSPAADSPAADVAAAVARELPDILPLSVDQAVQEVPAWRTDRLVAEIVPRRERDQAVAIAHKRAIAHKLEVARVAEVVRPGRDPEAPAETDRKLVRDRTEPVEAIDQTLAAVEIKSRIDPTSAGIPAGIARKSAIDRVPVAVVPVQG